jgi:hypothetical protein
MNNTPGVEKNDYQSLFSMAVASLSLMLVNPLTAIQRLASSSEGRTGNTMTHPHSVMILLMNVESFCALCNRSAQTEVHTSF